MDDLLQVILDQLFGLVISRNSPGSRRLQRLDGVDMDERAKNRAISIGIGHEPAWASLSRAERVGMRKRDPKA
ncbi:MAG: hypothetical protein WCO90_05260 [Planctomycetota bacterium]